MIGDGRAKNQPEDQPMPTANDLPFVHDVVAADIMARGELGKRRYGTKLQPFNGRNVLQDIYEELLDAACYIKQRMLEEEQHPLIQFEANELSKDWDQYKIRIKNNDGKVT